MMETLAGMLFMLISLGILGIVVALQAPRKSMSFRLESSKPLFKGEEPLARHLRSDVDGSPVSDAVIVTLRVVNDGNVVIRPQDYIEPLSVQLQPGARILDAEVTGTGQGSPAPRFRIAGERLVVEPIPLARGDTLAIKLLASGGVRSVRTGGAIAGIHDVESRRGDTPGVNGVVASLKRFVHHFGEVLLLNAFLLCAMTILTFPTALTALFSTLLVLAFAAYLLVLRHPRHRNTSPS